jgi:ribose 1,5-bisphosphokinase PhnN
MRTQRRKKAPKKVIAIDRRSGPVDVLSDEEMERVAELQALAWEAHRTAAAAALEIDARIRHGAVITATRYKWDARLKMVRSRSVAS